MPDEERRELVLDDDTRAAWEVVDEAARESPLFNATVYHALNDLLDRLEGEREPDLWVAVGLENSDGYQPMWPTEERAREWRDIEVEYLRSHHQRDVSVEDHPIRPVYVGDAPRDRGSVSKEEVRAISDAASLLEEMSDYVGEDEERRVRYGNIGRSLHALADRLHPDQPTDPPPQEGT